MIEHVNISTMQTADALYRLVAAQRMDASLVDCAQAIESAARNHPENTDTAWLQRMCEAGAALGLDVRAVEAAISDLPAIVSPQGPVAAFFGDGNNATNDRWLVVDKVSGRKLRVSGIGEAESRWMSSHELAELTALPNSQTSRTWLIAEPALPLSSSAARHDAHGDRPLRRLMRLLRAERSDIWVVVMFAIGVGVLSLATPIAVEALVNTVANVSLVQPLVVLTALLFVGLSLANAMLAAQTYVVELIQRRVFVRVVADLAHRLPRVQLEAFDREHGPELVNRFFDVLTVQKVGASLLLEGIAIILGTIIGMIVLAFYHPFLIVYNVLLVSMLVFAVFVLGRGAVPSSIEESRAKYAIAGWLEEMARHPWAFRTSPVRRFAARRADRLATHYVNMRVRHFRVLLRQILFLLAAQAGANTLLLGLGGWLVVNGQMNLGQLVAAELIVGTIVGGFTKLGKQFEGYYDLMAAMEKLGHLIDLPLERGDGAKLQTSSRGAAVSVRNLTFSFPEGSALFEDLSFLAAPGVRLALTGNGPNGKSTLIELLFGMRWPTSGTIEIDGVDSRYLHLESMRDAIAAVTTPEIFSGTLMDNIALGRPDVGLSEVRDALELAGLWEMVQRLPEGLYTEIPTGGGALAESERHQLMLARAIAGKPRLLLLDETLDRLDASELAPLLPALTSPERPWTLIVATTQNAVVSACDKRLALDVATAVNVDSTSAANRPFAEPNDGGT